MKVCMHRLILLSLVLLFGGCASNAPSPQSLNWTGNEAYFKRDYNNAIKWYSASLDESLKTNDKQFSAISMYGLARANGHLCNLDEAESWLIKSIEARKSLTNLETAYLSQNIFELGRLYIAQEKWENANAQFLQALPMLESMDMESIDPLGYANLLEEYQQILQRTGNDKLVSTNLEKIEQLRKNNQAGRAQYVSDPYPANCTLNKSSKKDALERASS